MLTPRDPFAEPGGERAVEPRPSGLGFVPPTEAAHAATVPGVSPAPVQSSESGPFSPAPPTAAPADRTPSEAGVSSATLRFTSCSDSRPALAKFRADSAFRGKEWRQLTYFPIYTEVLVSNDGNFTVPDVPAAPHLRIVDSGVKRNDWDRGSCAVVERRYSEVCDLRELLCYQFPHLIVPPLPAKSLAGDVETYFNATDALQGQRDNLQFFLREMAAMPELIFFSQWVPQFFLEPRDSFESGTLLAMRHSLTCFQEASKFVNEFSQRRRSVVEDTATVVAAKSTQLVRSVTSLLWGKKPSDEDAPAHLADTLQAGSGRPGLSSLSASALADAEGWQEMVIVLGKRRKALRQSARSFEAYLVALKQERTEVLKVAEVATEFESGQRISSDAQLAEYAHKTAQLLHGVAAKESDYSKGRYLNVCLRLFFEGHYVDAALDSIDHVLSLYSSVGGAHKFDSNTVAYREALNYAETVSRALHTEMRRYTRHYNLRMRNLLAAQLTVPLSTLADGVAASTVPSAAV